MRKIGQGLQQTTALQSVQSIKGQVQKTLDSVTPMLQNFPAQMQAALQSIEQLEVQVDQLEQMRAKVQEQAQQAQQTTASKKSKHSLEKMPEHPGPRGKKENKDLPDFWRRNFDYGESPYMNIGFIEKITDKPSISKKKKKSNLVGALISLADYFDGLGLRKEADQLDKITKLVYAK